MNRLNGFIDAFVDQSGWRQHAGIWSGISRGDTVIQSSGAIAISGFQNIRVEVFGASGVMEYRQGPFESLYLKNSFNDTFSPLMTSGNVRDITNSRSIYQRGINLILIDSGSCETTSSEIRWVTGNRQFTFATAGFRWPLHMSGIFNPPTAKQQFSETDVGDMAFFGHGNVIPNAAVTFPNSQAEASAMSYGPGTLAIQTGSGVINVSTGSGIAMFTGGFENPQAPLFITGRQRVPLQNVVIADSMIVPEGVYSGVRFMVPGLYKVDYSVTIEKANGTNSRTMFTWAMLLNRGNEPQFPTPSPTPVAISGSTSYGIVTNTTNACNFCMSKSFLVNADRGQFLALEVGTTRAAAAGQDVTILGSGTTCIIQYIGPRRSGF